MKMLVQASHRQVLERLMEVLAGRLDIANAKDLIADEAIIHMDKYTFRGVQAWQTWVSFIRSRPKMDALGIVCEQFEFKSNAMITARGRWFLMAEGKEVAIHKACATYRFEAGKIAELWTTRSNYTLMFGEMVRYQLGLWWVFTRLWVWSQLRDS